jgi:hypothetical protein
LQPRLSVKRGVLATSIQSKDLRKSDSDRKGKA